MVFRDREDAAERLVDKLKNYHLMRPLVLAIPRGAVPMAQLIAERLGGDLDIVLVHKFSPPWHPELAIGAATEDGEIRLNRVARQLGLTEEDVRDVAREQIRNLRERRQLFTPYKRPLDPAGRDVIIVDDGIATGATMRAAAMVTIGKGAARVIAAAPVASPEAAQAIRDDGVETCFLAEPEMFFAVSQFYEEFPQVEDEQVIEILTNATEDLSRARRPPQGKPPLRP